MQEDPSLFLKNNLKPYGFYFTNKLFTELESILLNSNVNKSGYIFVITDSNVAKIYLQQLMLSLRNFGFTKSISIVVKNGERSKSLKTYNKLIKKITSYNSIDKNSTVVAFGGGVIGDLAGFCASTILRGINFINIPTTLLAMSDSSIGGKNGINTAYGKNSLGTFYKAKTVIIAPKLLKTLPFKELNSGFFEILKIALIRDKQFFNYLENNYQNIITNNKEQLDYTILKSIEHKLQIVEEDFLETKNLRYLLNFGHTYGHALESYFAFKKIPHGYAVAIGMICANFLSHSLLMLSKDECTKINLIIKNKLGDFKYKKFNINKLYKLMLNDKKQSNGSVNIVALKTIGDSVFLKNVKKHNIEQSLAQGLSFIK